MKRNKQELGKSKKRKIDAENDQNILNIQNVTVEHEVASVFMPRPPISDPKSKIKYEEYFHIVKGSKIF